VPVLSLAELADVADVVVECAPAAVFAEVAEPAVRAGRIFVPITVGALLSHWHLVELATQHGARIIVPSGALLGLDAVKAASVTRIPMYRLVTVILLYCAIGVFALNNIVFDLWALFWFGLLGYAMRCFGFPLAPMILGVVLGDNAEINLIRALASDSDLTLFVTRPWSLFFLMIASFSIAFPWYQSARGIKRWAAFYVPAVPLVLSIPLLMMGGTVRPVIATGLFVSGVWLLWRAINPADLARALRQ
jgi:hypothetical protein